jgi:hypothetical protein
MRRMEADTQVLDAILVQLIGHRRGREQPAQDVAYRPSKRPRVIPAQAERCHAFESRCVVQPFLADFFKDSAKIWR